MIKWFFALSIVALSSIIIKPKRSVHVWLFPAIVIMGSGLISGLIVYFLLSPYKSGELISTLFLPAIISYFTLAYLLRLKHQNGYIKKIQFIIVIGILLIFSAPSMITFYLQKSTSSNLKNLLNSSNQENSFNLVDYHKDLLSNKDEIWALNYHHLSFGHEGFWEISAETIEEDLAYQVTCENRADSTEFILIMWLVEKVDPEELASGFIKELEASNYRTSPINKPFSSDKSRVSFSFSKTDLHLGTGTNSSTLSGNFGEIESYIIGPRTVLIMKQSHSKENLFTLFKTIEESMEFID